LTFWICDVHGVLVDSTTVVRDAFAATAARYRLSISDRQFHAVKGLCLAEAYRRLDPGGDAQTRSAFHRQYVHERIAEVRAFHGVRETLVAARAMGIRIGATTCHGALAEAALATTGLYSLIDGLVTQDEVLRPKPHPDSILKTLLLLGGVPGESHAIHIGDTAEDIAAGKAAGVLTVGATCGVSTEAEIRAAGPDYVIEAFADMWAWLRTAEPGPEMTLLSEIEDVNTRQLPARRVFH
jgi:phosphoglycolate phosphatase